MTSNKRTNFGSSNNIKSIPQPLLTYWEKQTLTSFFPFFLFTWIISRTHAYVLTSAQNTWIRKRQDTFLTEAYATNTWNEPFFSTREDSSPLTNFAPTDTCVECIVCYLLFDVKCTCYESSLPSFHMHLCYLLRTLILSSNNLFSEDKNTKILEFT